MSNLVQGHYRSVSVADVDIDLDEASLRAHFIGREAYRRTAFIVVRSTRTPGAAAIIAVTKAAEEPLFSPIIGLDLLARSDECALVDSPQTDVGVPTQLAAAARTLAPGVRGVVVTGRYHHISFIIDPLPYPVRVVEVAPPVPAKLLDQARRLIDVAEELPPLDLRPEIFDLAELAAAEPSARYLFPCQGSGAAPVGANVSYLDQRPPLDDWVLVGCARSRQLHRWFYSPSGDVPSVEICPRVLAGHGAGGRPGPTLTKCCLLEEGIVTEGSCVVVPWGASLEEVRRGLREVAAMAQAAAEREAHPDQGIEPAEPGRAEQDWAPA